MTVDAEKLRNKFYGKEKLKAEDVLDVVISFPTPTVTAAEPDEHFFRVELIDIVETNNDLEEHHERKFLIKEKCRPFVA